MVTGPIAIAYNVKGVDNLVLTADVAAKIFNGDDHHLERPGDRRPQLRTPRCRPTPIKVFFRSDESGTTENFTKYLKAAAPTALDRRARQEVDRQGRGQGEVGRCRRARVEVDRRRRHLRRVVLRQGQQARHRPDRQRLGPPVELTGESAGKAVAAREAGRRTGNDLRLEARLRHQGGRRLPDRPGDLRDRLLARTWTPAKATLVKALPRATSPHRRPAVQLEEIGYAPLPDEVQTKVAAAVDALCLTRRPLTRRRAPDRRPPAASRVSSDHCRASPVSPPSTSCPTRRAGRPSTGTAPRPGRLGDRLFGGAASGCRRRSSSPSSP